MTPPRTQFSRGPLDFYFWIICVESKRHFETFNLVFHHLTKRKQVAHCPIWKWAKKCDFGFEVVFMIRWAAGWRWPWRRSGILISSSDANEWSPHLSTNHLRHIDEDGGHDDHSQNHDVDNHVFFVITLWADDVELFVSFWLQASGFLRAGNAINSNRLDALCFSNIDEDDVAQWWY